MPNPNLYLQRLPQDPEQSQNDQRELDPSLDELLDEVGDEPSPIADEPAHPGLRDGRDPRADARPDPTRAPGQRTRSGRKAVPTPRNPGLSGSAQEYAKVMEVLTEQVRREWPDNSVAQVKREARLRFDRITRLRHPKLWREYLKLQMSSWCPPRAGLRPCVEVKALRQAPEWQELEDILRDKPPGRSGRGTDRRLPMAVMAYMTLMDGAPQLTSSWMRFGGSDRELDWAFQDCTSHTEGKQLYRTQANANATLKAMLKRIHPDLCIKQNLKLLKRFARRHPLFGKYLVVDGTPVERWLSQEPPVSALHAEMQVGDTGAGHNYHAGAGEEGSGGKGWIGNVLLVIADLITGLPLIWMVLEKGPIYPHIIGLLDRLRDLAPWISPAYMVGDREMDSSARFAFDLQVLHSIVPVFPLRNSVSEHYAHWETRGVPHCAQHGEMKYHQADDQLLEHPPRELPDDYDEAKMVLNARIRWVCEECHAAGIDTRETTYVRDNPRLYPLLPRGGRHPRAALRIALMLKRNIIESVFSQLKRRGVADIGHNNCRWVREAHQLEWLLGLALFGMSARRDAHESGRYTECAEEAWRLDLVKRRPAPSPVDRAA